MTASHARLLSSDWPFPGLRPFTFADAEYLFGRNEQKYALYRMLDRGRFVSVIGSSGSGKSSLVFAALLPVLHAENEEDRNKRKGERAWVWTDLRPGRAPLRNLADALARLSGDSDGEVTQARREWIAYYLRRSSLGIVDVLTETDSIGSGRLVIIVDQFEELFRFAGSHEGNGGAPEQQAQSRNEAESFVQLLIEASRSRDCKVNILITMRSDFIGDCARFQGLPELVSAVQFLVPALSRSQREEVICKPLAKSGSSIEPALVKSLLNDSDSDFDQLPVLQHCLLRLWEKAGPVQAAVPANGPSAEAIAPTGASPRQLTLKHYDAIGWMSGALSRHANEIMGDLPGLEWTIEKTFRALAEIDRDGRAIRRSRLFKQLKDETGVADDALRRVLDRFRADDCSFLTPSSFAQKALLEETSIDVSHEALLRRWQRASGDPTATDAAAIKGWLRVEDDDGQHYRRLLSTKKVDAKQIKEEWTWWNALRPTPDWAKRYGGRYEQVKEMLESSWRSRNIGIGTKVAGAAAIAAALVVAPFVAQEIALKERSAVESYLLAVSSADLLMDEVQEALNRGALPLASARKLLTVAEKIVEQVNVKETALVARMRSELLVMTSDVYGDLDDTDNALKYAKTAKALAESFLRSNPTNRGWQIALYRSLFRIADAEANLKDDAQALQDYRQALDIVETIFKKAPNDPEIGREVAFIYGKLGDMSLKHGKSQDARVDYDKSVQILQDLVAKYPDNEPCARDLGTSYARVGWALQAQDKYQDALAMYHMALETRERLLAKRQHSTTYLSHVADSLIEVANTLMRLKRSEEAIAEYRKAVMRRQAALDEDATNLAYQGALAAGLELLGDALKKTGNSAEAMDNYKKALAIRERLVGADPANLKRQRSLENLKKRMDEPASAPIEQVGTVPPSRP